MRAIRTFALLLLLSVPAQAQEPPAQLDAATRAALGIPEETENAAVRGPQTSSGAWTWTTGTFRYDGAGNIAAIGTEAFYYDRSNRLTQAWLSRPDQPGFQVQSYGYDSFGNMTSRTTNGSTQSFAVSQTTNHLTAAGSVYDAAGNVKEWRNPAGGVTYRATYDALNMMQEVEALVSYVAHDWIVYTAGDERIWTYNGATNSSRWTIRDFEGKVLREYTDNPSNSPAWSVSRDYVYRGSSMLAAVTPTGTIYFSLDHLGTPRVITNDSRVRVGFHHYFPFGEEWLDNSGTQEGERQKFTGHERDTDVAGDSTGLDYMHARYYTARWGRFLSVDPGNDWDPQQPQTWNLYTYSRNNPVRYFDPDGLKARLYTYVGFTNPGPKSELPTANSIRSQLRTELGSRIENHRLQMNPKASPADFRSGLADSEGITMFIGHAFTPGPGLKFNDAQSDWLQNVTSNNSVVLLGSCDSAGYAKLFGVDSSSQGKAFVGFAGQVNSMVLAEMTTMIVKLMEKGKSIGDAVAAVRAELASRGVQPSDFRIVLIGDASVTVTDEEFRGPK
jgi:RHS repeat-associated protein